MRFKRIWVQILVFLCVLLGGFWGSGLAQQAPKREMRAAWIATVANIDWPSRPGLPVAVQRAEFIRLLDTLKHLGMNAVVVQVRPVADAFYASDKEPWSYYLNGKQGQAPAPYYDPLQFMIQQTHARGMEFHAWFNPYRAVLDPKRISPQHVSRLHPEWFVTYGGKKYFNPGLPEVWHYLVSLIEDVVSRYDVDAVQFDDYFYPYRIRGQAFPDSRAYARYGKGRSLGDWRRHNVDTVIQMLSTGIKAEKPWVKFGISPFGVWRNRDRDPDGSLTQSGQTNYDDLYADVLLWLKQGWIDYVCPQLYWEFGNRYNPYEVLLDWWAHHSYGRQLYIGQALYRIGTTAAWSPGEMPAEIRANRTYPQVKGSMFFSASVFYKNPSGFADSLREDLYRHIALVPTMPWIDSLPPPPPTLLSTMSLPEGLLLQWKSQDTTQETIQFVIYRFSGDAPGDFDDPAHILAVVNRTHPADTTSIEAYTDHDYVPGAHYVYAVTALDRLHNESPPGNFLYVPTRDGPVPKALYHPGGPGPPLLLPAGLPH